MPGMHKAKSINQIYELTEGFDIVITSDAPLRSALNKSIRRPMLGQFAYTPKELGHRYAPYIFEHPMLDMPGIVLTVSDRLGIPLKAAHHMVDNVMNIWTGTGSLDKAREFVSASEFPVLDLISHLPTDNLAMQEMDLRKLGMQGKRIAIIGREFFTELDKRVLPDEYVDIPVLDDEILELPAMHLFDSPRDIIDRIVAMITKENQDDVAVVLNTESDYLPIMKSRLLNKGLEIHQREFLKDDFSHRMFISLILHALERDRCTVRDISGVANLFGLKFDPEHMNYLFSKYAKLKKSDRQVTWFNDLLKTIPGMTFSELESIFTDRSISLPEQLPEAIRSLGLHESRIGMSGILDLIYYIDNFEIAIGESRNGILLADAKASAFIDRPVVFYAGLDASWTRPLEAKPWSDRKAEEKISMMSFQILLQQGEQRFCFVPRLDHNELVIPCYYFNILLEKDIGSFSDGSILTEQIRNGYLPAEKTRQKEDMHIMSHKEKLFSQSRLNEYITCPKSYSYSLLSGKEDNAHFSKGNLLHAFAEFYVNYPDFVRENGLDQFLGIMLSVYSRMVHRDRLQVEKSIFRIGCLQMMEFIDSLDIRDCAADAASQGSQKNSENIFAKHFCRPIWKRNAEVEFSDTELGICGIIDLLVSSELAIDYKSARNLKTPSDIMRKANLRMLDDEIDIQPLLYLTELRRRNPGKPIGFWYYFCLGSMMQAAADAADISDNIVRVRYIPTSYQDFLTSDEFFGVIKIVKTVDSIVSKVGPENLKPYLAGTPLPDFLGEEDMLKSGFADGLRALIIQLIGKDTQTLRSGIDSLLNQIVSVRTGKRQTQVYLFKEDIDDFEKFVKERQDMAKEHFQQGFPFAPMARTTCKDCSFARLCLRCMGQEGRS